MSGLLQSNDASFPTIDVGQASVSSVDRWKDLALIQPADRFLSRFGKRVRAAVVHEAYRLAGGMGNAPVPIAEAIEWLHAGSLIIDDIEDDSSHRRGAPTLHREIGLPLALNTGNWMYFCSLEKLVGCASSLRMSRSLIFNAVRTVRLCHEGQALDLATRVDTVEVCDLYPIAREISRKKTGGLMALASWLGATAAGGNAPVKAALRRFGMGLGICLQMLNDLDELRNVVRDEDRIDDLRNARVTWPWAWACSKVDPVEVRRLQQHLREARGDRGGCKIIAERLLEWVDDAGQRRIDTLLEKELDRLASHVPSVASLRLVLARLRSRG
jgi:geranylgeranyl pyrophosphate synthase